FTWQNVVGFIVIGAIYVTGILLTWRRARVFTAAEKNAAAPQSQTVS
ncbi:MAG: PTS galactitol transporter subunit IIC, partial [Enterobacter sp.]|nr:PTS galactitol transporter subunit IIC [Enterobacter sp.]